MHAKKSTQKQANLDDKSQKARSTCHVKTYSVGTCTSIFYSGWWKQENPEVVYKISVEIYSVGFTTGESTMVLYLWMDRHQQHKMKKKTSVTFHPNQSCLELDLSQISIFKKMGLDLFENKIYNKE